MRVLIVEDDTERLNWFFNTLNTYKIDYTKFPEEAIKLLKQNEYDYIFLDHDLLEHHYKVIDIQSASLVLDEETGYCVAKWLAENLDNNNQAEIFVHSLNPDGSLRMVNIMEQRNVKRVPYNILKKNIMVN